MTADNLTALPVPDLFIGTKLVPYEERSFGVPGMAEKLGYGNDIRRYYSEATVRALLAARDAERGRLLSLLMECRQPVEYKRDVIIEGCDHWHACNQLLAAIDALQADTARAEGEA